MLLDGDILCFIMKNSRDNSTMILVTTALSWVINQISHSIDTKKDNLKRHKPGSITANESKVIWVLMSDRFGFHSDDLSVREAFNSRLIDLLAD